MRGPGPLLGLRKGHVLIGLPTHVQLAGLLAGKNTGEQPQESRGECAFSGFSGFFGLFFEWFWYHPNWDGSKPQTPEVPSCRASSGTAETLFL